MNKKTIHKRKILDEFDRQFFSFYTAEDSKILNQVGKINVGWNLDYIKSLPKYDLLIDVGAADDFYTLHAARPEATSILIDANIKYEDVYKAFLKERSGFYKICAVGDENGEVQYTHYLNSPYLSSIEHRSDFKTSEKEIYSVPLKKLDDLIELDLSNRFALLKLDIEGAELRALKGAGKILDRCTNVICEVSLDENFPGGNNFSEINALMVAAGFGIRDVIRVPRIKYNSYPAQVLDFVYGR
jgi:FkbM family methyltransferase